MAKKVRRIVTESEVWHVYFAAGKQRDLAAKFGIPQTTVSRIKRGVHPYSKHIFRMEARRPGDCK
jgi:hypothetical protein